MQLDFFNKEENLALNNKEENLTSNTTKKPSVYFDAHGAEYLAKSFFSYQKCEVFSAPESNIVDFCIKHNNKYIPIQVKSAICKKDKYEFYTRKVKFFFPKNGRRVRAYTHYLYKDVQLFVLVANDIKKIYVVKNKEQTFLSLKREDFFKFEDNKENFLNQIFSSLE